MKTNKEMTLGGIGPRMVLLCLPYIALSVGILIAHPDFLDISWLQSTIVRYIGFGWLAAGIILWISSVITFVSAFQQKKLVTSGPFAICRNPVYASFIVFIIPALGVIFHSGLILSIALVMYLAFKICIHGEMIVLRRTFGEDYENYLGAVNELFPFPRFKKQTK